MSEENILKPEQNYGPGNVLRSKREEYEWSVDAVAEALHLSTSSVKAIEADRYEDLPGATYVMGYWRSYARLLGIDIEETIEANKQNLNVVTAEASGMDVNRAFKHSKKGGGGKWLFFLILLGVFAYFAWQPPQLFGLLEQYQQQNATPETSAESAQTAAELEAVVEEADPRDQVLRSVKKPVEVSEQAPAEATADASGLVLKQVKSSPADAGNDAAGESASSAPLNLSESQSTTATSAAATGSGTTDVAQKEQSLTFKITKATWLDVRDHSRKVLYKETAKADTEVVVSGTPPFYILIQPPEGASLSYKGKEVPFKAHKNGLYARFKLGDKLEAL